MSTAHLLPTFDDFPGTLEEITSEWLTKVLNANHINAQVDSFTTKRIGTGQVGINVRMSLKYKSWSPENAPATLVAKLVSTDPVSRATGIMARNYVREAAFYRETAPILREKGMTIAKCYAAEFCPKREATFLLMEDMHPAEAGDQVAGVTPEAMEKAVRDIAIMHATFWNSPRLQELSPWLEGPKRPETDDAPVPDMYNNFYPLWVERYRDRLTPEMEAVGAKFGTVWMKWAKERKAGPVTLAHGDFRIDNILIGPSDSNARPSFIVPVDWQTPQINAGGLDVGYCIGSGLLPEDRKTHERRLVEIYHNELVKHGVKDFTFDDAWNDYRHGQFSGVAMSVIASMLVGRTDRGDEMFWAMGSRHLKAAIETNAVELLEQLAEK